MSPMLIAALAGAAVACLVPVRDVVHKAAARPAPVADTGWVRRGRLLWAVLAGAAAVTVLGGIPGRVAALPVGVACWVLAGRAESASERRRRESLRTELPVVVLLLASALEAGAAPGEAVAVVCEALPGAAADALAPVAARLRLGAQPDEAWSRVPPELAPLGRAMARAQVSGAPVVATVSRLASDLARTARAEAEDRARRVGVKAAVPLGVCLLPSFLLIGIVPVVGGLIGALGL